MHVLDSTAPSAKKNPSRPRDDFSDHVGLSSVGRIPLSYLLYVDPTNLSDGPARPEFI